MEKKQKKATAEKLETKELIAGNEQVEDIKKARRKSHRPAFLTKKERKEQGIGKDIGKASLKYARISSRKVAIVLNLIKNKNIDEAYAIVRHTPKAASEIIQKLLKSAEANAVNNNSLERDELFVSEAYATQGPTLKRVSPRSRGMANRILKRSSHITLVVKERE